MAYVYGKSLLNKIAFYILIKCLNGSYIDCKNDPEREKPSIYSDHGNIEYLQSLTLSDCLFIVRVVVDNIILIYKWYEDDKTLNDNMAANPSF